MPDGRVVLLGNDGTRTTMMVHASDDDQGHNFSTVPTVCRNSTASWPCFDTGGGPAKNPAGYSSLTFVDSSKPYTVGLAWETSGPGATCVGARCRVLFSIFDVPVKTDDCVAGLPHTANASCWRTDASDIDATSALQAALTRHWRLRRHYTIRWAAVAGGAN